MVLRSGVEPKSVAYKATALTVELTQCEKIYYNNGIPAIFLGSLGYLRAYLLCHFDIPLPVGTTSFDLQVLTIAGFGLVNR